MNDPVCEVCGVWRRPILDPDPCLGLIPGVCFACCGHGNPEKAYVILGGEPDQPCYDGHPRVTLWGQAAVEFFKLVQEAQRNPQREGDYIPVPAKEAA